MMMRKLPAIFLLLLLLVNILVASVQARDGRQTADNVLAHKVVAEPSVLNANTPGVTLLADYSTYQLFAVTEAQLRRLNRSTAERVILADEMDVITLNGRSFDTQRDALTRFTQAAPAGGALQIIQFVGPIKDEWLAAVSATGSDLIHYVANNGYLVWADENGRSQLNTLAAEGAFIQFSAPYPSALKPSPALVEQGISAEKTAVLPVTIQMVQHDGQAASEALLADLMVTQTSAWQPLMNFQTIYGTIRAEDITVVTALPDVYWVGLQQPRELMDEVQGQILAGSIIITSTYSGMPSGPGYLAWLDSYGFSQDLNDYPLVDITDDGIGNGSAEAAGGDRTFREFGLLANPSRVAYIENCTDAASAAGPGGHGHLNLSIAGGYDVRNGFPYRDSDGYQLGLGINPYGRFGGTRVFNNNGFWNISACGGTDTALIQQNQNSGAQISSNSWGCSTCAGTYDAASQAYDVGVRDADLSEPGSQQMIYLFSAGNGSNAYTISTPGNAKNVITVGASENYRPYGIDGCNKGPDLADDVMDMAPFSSRGPAPGDRVKPDLAAPGSHVQGTAATTPFFTGDNICGGTNSPFFPAGQTVFTWSSGTSHAAPAVAGMASLYYYLLEDKYELDFPSPAVIKAYLMAHTRYLTGARANDNLPSNSQGYGLPDMSVGLDSTPRFLLDQSTVFGGSGEQWTQTVYAADPTKPVRIVLAYTDQAGAVGTNPQVNDLDLRVASGANVYLGNRISGQWSVTGGTPDRANNVEAVFLQPGAAESLDITVTAFNIAGDGVPGNGDATDQDFALVCTNCLAVDFGLTMTPSAQTVCSSADADYTVQVFARSDFAGTVALGAEGIPAGATTVFNTNPTIPPDTITLTVGNLVGAAAGSYQITVSGSDQTITQTTSAALNLFSAAPEAPGLLSPPDQADEQPLAVELVWEQAAPGVTYTVEIAADEAFTQIVEQASGLTVNQYQPQNLAVSTLYFWRVQADNVCGSGVFSTPFRLTTLTPPEYPVYLPVVMKN
ncbi:MAG: S8 family serine peptidase [Chloroflexota bacterium]